MGQPKDLLFLCHKKVLKLRAFKLWSGIAESNC
jgi:hypothetical protein